VHGLGDFAAVVTLLQAALNDDVEKEWLIKPGYNAELDRLRELMAQGSQALAELERCEQERTGIASLKIKHNSIHGYAFEVTKANFSAVPADFVRVQSLVGRDRFTTQALKDLEYDLARAERDGNALEQELYRQVCEQVAAYAAPLKKMSQAVAQCDALLGLARVAYAHGYVRPQFHADAACRDICIEAGKHPVVASVLQHAFIPNDTQLIGAQRTWIITGPNMGGKSTYLRQVALVCVMAQVGSFVPASRAQLPLLDRIFTRIGAADNVAQGKSTFLVEMEETALICNQATEKSLVILDEVGRGTSTYDGLAIAQAVVEYLHETVKARALFATHYHELTALADAHPGMAMYHAASKKTEHGIMLLHKIRAGVADGSFGLEVAKGAQLPAEIVARAENILNYLKQKEAELALCAAAQDGQQLHHQMQFYAGRIATLEQELNLGQTLAQRLAQIDYDSLSPKQALDILWDLRK
jgi:DNA mismatch repair protein MutS